MKNDKPPQQFGQREGVEQKRNLSADEKAIRKLAAEKGITPAAAAELLRNQQTK